MVEDMLSRSGEVGVLESAEVQDPVVTGFVWEAKAVLALVKVTPVGAVGFRLPAP
jgi:hypothetical protein